MVLILRSLLIALLAGVLSGCGTMADPREWFGGDESLKPAELVDFSPTIKPQILWSVNIGAGSDSYPDLMPAIGAGSIFVVDAEGVLQARDRDSGQLQWEVKTGLPVSSGPSLGDDILVVGTSEGELVAFDQEAGKELWRRSLSSEILARPAIDGDWIVVHTADGNLFGLEAVSGVQQWRYDHKVPVLTLRGSSSPVVDGGSVFCGLSGGKLISLSLDSGVLEWETHVTVPSGRTDLERMVDVDADPVVYSGTVYAAAYQGHVAAVGAGSGKVFWKREMSVYNNMAVNWQQLAVTDAQGFVWSLDPDSGSARWRQQALKNRRLSAPALLSDYVVVGDYEGYLHWLSADDGSLAARIHVSSDPIVAPLQVVDDTLYVLGSDGKLSALRLPETGESE